MVKQVSTTKILVARVVGAIQCVLGGLASAFAFLIYASPSIQDALTITSGEIALYMFLLSALGIFLIISGLLLLRKEVSWS